MKIVIVATSIVPGNSLGIEHFTYRLVNALSEYYSQNEYVILIPAGTLNEWLSRVPQKDNLSFVMMKISPTAWNMSNSGTTDIFGPIYSFLKNLALVRFIYYKLRQFELRKVLQQQKPDIVFSPFHVEILAFGPWKTVLSVHDLRELMPEFYDRSRAPLLRTNIAHSEAIIVAWKHPFEQLSEMFPELKSKTHLVPFQIPINGPFTLVEDHDPAKEIILFASALREQKNHINLLKAMPAIIKERASKNKQVLLVCAGTCHSPIYEALMEKVSELSIDANVTFTGFIPDTELRELYAQSTMIISPTLWEAASGSIFEAFSFGKPVACSNIPPLVAQAEQSGAYVNFFDPLDSSDIARAVIEVLETPSLFVQGSLNGANFLRSLSWEMTAKQYMKVFVDVQRDRQN